MMMCCTPTYKHHATCYCYFVSCRSRTGGPFKGKVYRSYPQEWRDKYDKDPKYAGISSATKDVSWLRVYC